MLILFPYGGALVVTRNYWKRDALSYLHVVLINDTDMKYWSALAVAFMFKSGAVCQIRTSVLIWTH